VTGQPTARAVDGYPHDALFYDSADDLLEVAVPFLLRGLEIGDAAVIAAGAAATRVLCDALGADPRVQVMERSDVYNARTATAIITYRRLAEREDRAPGSRVRIVGEIDYGCSDRDRLEWQRYEAVINKALVGWPLSGMCLFDTARLPDSVLESASSTHQHLATPRGRQRNARFVEPAEYLRSLPVPSEPLLDTPPRLWAKEVADFIGLRHAVAAELATVAAPRDLIDDFLLAVDEMTSNALRHGQPPVDLRLWIGSDRIVGLIGDSGTGWDDPFAGYGPAHGEDLSRGGMGLWLARQLCDHVDIEHGDDGVRVRLTTRLT
jgi:anti-sigma regulatory factor (Ser/Thr protein kinase)